MTLVADPMYMLHNRGEILSIVERLQRERSLTTVEFADGHAIVSSLLEIRRDAGTLVFDVARDPEQNHRLFASPTLAFVSELDHVRIAFETNAPSPVQLADGPAAMVALPTAVIRLQRREWFRAALPVQPPIRCSMLDRQGHVTAAQAIDLSEGGTALVVDDPAAGDAEPGSDHALILSLPEVGRLELEATLRTVTKAVMPSAGGTARVRLGFRFESMSPRTATQIQRYVQRLETNELRMLKRRAG